MPNISRNEVSELGNEYVVLRPSAIYGDIVYMGESDSGYEDTLSVHLAASASYDWVVHSFLSNDGSVDSESITGSSGYSASAQTLEFDASTVAETSVGAIIEGTDGVGTLSTSFDMLWRTQLTSSTTPVYAVGYPYASTTGENAGAVDFAHRNSTTRLEGTTAGDYFGYDVSATGYRELYTAEDPYTNLLDDYIVAVGSPKNSTEALESGSVRFFSVKYTASTLGDVSEAFTPIYGDNDQEHFGWSVDVQYSDLDVLHRSGETLVAVGAPNNSHNGLASGAVRVYAWDGSAWQQRGNTIYGASAGDRFGWSVSLTKRYYTDDRRWYYLLIGAPQGEGKGTGYVRFYYWDGLDWVFQEELSGDDDGEEYGYSVSIASEYYYSGSTPEKRAAVGVPNYSKSGNNHSQQQLEKRGRVAVIASPVWSPSSSGTKWVEIDTDIVLSGNEFTELQGTSANENLGKSVAIDSRGNTIVFSSNLRTLVVKRESVDSDPLNDTYSIMFTQTDYNPSLAADIEHEYEKPNKVSLAVKPGATNSEKYTFAVLRNVTTEYISIEGSNTDVAPKSIYLNNIVDSYVIDYDQENISGPLYPDESYYLKPDNGSFSGNDVAVSQDGSTLVVGSPYDDSSTHYDCGSVGVYDWDGSDWIQRGSTLYGPENNSFLGFSVAVSSDGNRIACGAPGLEVPDYEGNTTTGSYIYVYDWDSSNWVLAGSPISPSVDFKEFGREISMSGDGNKISASQPPQGEIKTYTWEGSGWSTAVTTSQQGTYADFDDFGEFGYSIKISRDGNTLVVGAPTADNTNLYSSGHVRVYSWNGTTWNQLGATIQPPARQVGYAVAASSDGSRVALIDSVRIADGGTGNLLSAQVEVYDWDGSVWTKVGNSIDISEEYFSTNFSLSLSDDGNRVAIGLAVSEDTMPYISVPVPYEDGRSRVLVYDWNGSDWQQVGADIQRTPRDLFGYSVEVSGDKTLVAVGAPKESSSIDKPYSGTVSSYSFDGTKWNVLSTVTPNTNKSILAIEVVNSGGSFGDGVTPSNDAVAFFTPSVLSGASAVPSDSFSSWVQRGLDIEGEAASDNSGWSVSLSADGTVVAIGAPQNPYYDASIGSGMIMAGHVRVYEWDGTAWVQRGDDIDGEAAGDRSGTSVSLSADGTIVAIGAIFNLIGAGGDEKAGHVRVYEWNGTSWVQRGDDIDGEAAYDQSGHSVSLSADGTTVAIGAPDNSFEVPDPDRGPGYVRVYEWDGTSWVQKGNDIDGEAAVDQSGWSVSLSADGSIVAIGATYNDGNGTKAGHVRVYEWDGTSWVQRGADIDGEGIGDWSGWSVSLSADGSIVAIGAKNNVGNGIFAGHVRVYEWDGTAWVQKGNDIDGEAAGDQSGSSVSLSDDGLTLAIGAPNNDGDTGDEADNRGHVRIYEWNGSNWVQKGNDIYGREAGDKSGWSVSLSADGNFVAIGGPYAGDGLIDGEVAFDQFSGTTRVYGIFSLPDIQTVNIDTLGAGWSITRNLVRDPSVKHTPITLVDESSLMPFSGSHYIVNPPQIESYHKFTLMIRVKRYWIGTHSFNIFSALNGNSEGLTIKYSNENIVAEFTDGQNIESVSWDESSTVGEWVTLVVRRSPSSGLDLFVNGLAETSTSASALKTLSEATTVMKIGQGDVGDYSGKFAMSKISFFSEYLSDNEIAVLVAEVSG